MSVTSALEQTVIDQDQREQTRQCLTFILAGEEYAVDILRVQEIRGWGPVTFLPNTPDYLKGVLNLRGAIIPVVDLRIRFGLAPKEYGATTVVVVLRVLSGDRERIMGVVADAVAETYNIVESAILPPPAVHGAISSDFFEGLVTIDEKMIVILNVDELLNSGELAVDGAAAGG
ncbi:chemotaxis protein CheW [Marinobacterium jannaschii]|uniref:chemotaxis protein CheW n=1 Tax=Marinobacterium jannaschii TaxID=64970 RepID=UPI0009FC9D15|nr:chemotaxis protein CheW [Marinobacterium jannaschii]